MTDGEAGWVKGPEPGEEDCLQDRKKKLNRRVDRIKPWRSIPPLHRRRSVFCGPADPIGRLRARVPPVVLEGV